MNLTMALIADEANISQEGKLNILGIFDRIAAPTFPTVHPKMVFVFRIEARYGDGGVAMPVRVRLIDQDGGALFETSGEIVAPEVQPGDLATAHQIFTLVGIGFEKPGEYKFVVNLGDRPPHESSLLVVRSQWTGGTPEVQN